MTDEQLQQIHERAEKATPGPWHVLPNAATVVQHVSPQAGSINHIATVSEWGTAGCDREADAAFIAHAREDVPALLVKVKRLQKRVKDLEATLQHDNEWEQDRKPSW